MRYLHIYEVQRGEVVIDPMHEMGNAGMLRNQLITAEKTNALVGRRVRKWFQNQFFEGTLTKTEDYYHIVYDDGDHEDVSLDELVDILLPL